MNNKGKKRSIAAGAYNRNSISFPLSLLFFFFFFCFVVVVIFLLIIIVINLKNVLLFMLWGRFYYCCDGRHIHQRHTWSQPASVNPIKVITFVIFNTYTPLWKFEAHTPCRRRRAIRAWPKRRRRSNWTKNPRLVNQYIERRTSPLIYRAASKW